MSLLGAVVVAADDVASLVVVSSPLPLAVVVVGIDVVVVDTSWAKQFQVIKFIRARNIFYMCMTDASLHQSCLFLTIR